MKIVLFDIDGTLLLTGGVGINAFNRTFSELYGTGEVWNNYDPHGKTDSEIIRDLAKNALGYEPSHLEKIEIGHCYIVHFKYLIDSAKKFRLLPGAMRLLAALKRRGHLLGIATGNFKKTADLKLKRGKLDKFFSFGAYGSDAFQRVDMTRIALSRALERAGGKAKPKDVVLIGDAKQDVKCGKALGLRTVAVATGSVSYDQLSRLKPGLVVKDLVQTKKIIDFIER